MDRLASEKETALAQLAFVEAQLWMMREKSEAQSRKAEEFKSQLGSAVSDREALEGFQSDQVGGRNDQGWYRRDGSLV